ncbi:N-acyl homoserine lactonase family protein [Paraburkholderia caffeinilytica]|uniref:N-acyl homoserine lactonase family protein n=1 Tax=Paraburkholderia caffeinilytica TaxID=1761016 RepID=UPI0038BCDEA2
MNQSQTSIALPDYEVFAIRYASRPGDRQHNFLGGDPHDAPMEMDYFVWLIRNEQRVFVVDTGFSAEVAAKRGRTFLRRPIDGLRMLGVDAEQVEDVIITHLHYDHVGTFADFTRARFHLQDDEMAYATGRYMGYRQFSHSFEVEDVVGMVRKVYEGRVVFHAGDAELCPGITVHHIGGHTPGLQCVRVRTKRGWVVLASDASHYYEHFQTRRIFPTVFNVGDAIDGYRTLEQLADSHEHIIPGHDPLVMARYPPVSPELEGVAVRLNVPALPWPPD